MQQEKMVQQIKAPDDEGVLTESDNEEEECRINLNWGDFEVARKAWIVPGTADEWVHP